MLERDILTGINLAGNICVMERADLLERFIKIVEEQAQFAEGDGNTLIILIFKHGNDFKNGVYIGGKDPEADCSILSIQQQLKQMLPTGLNVTLVLTSCYSDGWLIQLSIHHKKPMNITGLQHPVQKMKHAHGP